MTTHSTAERLCVESTQAEFDGRIDDARALSLQAWEASEDDYDACISAHYVARYQETPEGILHWNQVALARADAVGDGREQSFYPSLYVNLGYAYERLGNQAEAKRFYKLAADLGLVHQQD